MPLKLLHLANFNSTNIGNGALISGTERCMREDFSREIEWHHAAWDDYTFGLKPFDSAFVDLINSHDGLIINGAVTLNGRDYLRETGTRVDLPLALWRKIKKPVIFHGISYRHWPGQPYHHLDKLQALFDYVCTHPKMLLGVRNDGTNRWLSSFAGVKHEPLLVPDPALFVETSENSIHPELAPGLSNVLIAFNDEDALRRYASPEQRRQVLQELAEAVQILAKNPRLHFVLVPHYFDDFSMMRDFIEICAPRFAHQRLTSTGLLKVDGTKHFYGLYKQAALAISMRVHSMSPSIGIGVPVIPVVTQDRMWDFLDDAGLRSIALDAFMPGLGKELAERAQAALADPSVLRATEAAATQAMRERMRAFNKRGETLFA